MSPFLIFHIAAGTISLCAGAGGLALRKGGKPHRLSGRVFVVAMLIMSGTSFAGGASGKVDKVENGGRQVTIAGKMIKLSGSRTKVTVGGKEASRGDIKAGMMCTSDTDSGTAKMVACK